MQNLPWERMLEGSRGPNIHGKEKEATKWGGPKIRGKKRADGRLKRKTGSKPGRCDQETTQKKVFGKNGTGGGKDPEIQGGVTRGVRGRVWLAGGRTDFFCLAGARDAKCSAARREWGKIKCMGGGQGKS